MSQDVNTVTISGRLTKDIELISKETSGGKTFNTARFTLACNRKPKKKADGTLERVADYILVSCTSPKADKVAQYCAKGDSLTIVNGEIHTREYVDQATNTKRTITEVVPGDIIFGPKSGKAAAQPATAQPAVPDAGDAAAEVQLDVSAEDLPW